MSVIDQIMRCPSYLGMGPVHQRHRVGGQVIRLEEDVAGPEILVTDCEELCLTALHLVEDHVVNGSIPGHLLEEEDCRLYRGELVQELEVRLEEPVNQAPCGLLPRLIRLQCMSNVYLYNDGQVNYRILSEGLSYQL